MTTQEWLNAHRKELLIGGGGFIGALLLAAILFYTPRPTFIDPPSSTKDPVVSLHGTVTPKRSVTAFDHAGNALVTVTANDNGEFTFTDIPITEGSNVLTFRAESSEWRSSFPVTLTIEKDTTAPSVLVSMLDGATVTGSNTVISGNAEPGSSVTVNGVQTSVGEDGSWSATVALQPGANTLTVTATDPAGNTTTETQTITYEPTATDSQTGTATVTASSTSISPGSQPAPTSTEAGIPQTTSTTASEPSTTQTTTQTPSQTSTETTSPPPPPPQPILSIVATASVSNPSPNNRANEIITVSVKDNYGHPVTDASVVATVNYKTGSQNYSLTSQGNGSYTVNFKLNEKYEPGYRVMVNATARYNGFTSTAQTSFTPM